MSYLELAGWVFLAGFVGGSLPGVVFWLCEVLT